MSAAAETTDQKSPLNHSRFVSTRYPSICSTITWAFSATDDWRMLHRKPTQWIPASAYCLFFNYFATTRENAYTYSSSACSVNVNCESDQNIRQCSLLLLLQKGDARTHARSTWCKAVCHSPEEKKRSYYYFLLFFLFSSSFLLLSELLGLWRSCWWWYPPPKSQTLTNEVKFQRCWPHSWGTNAAVWGRKVHRFKYFEEQPPISTAAVQHHAAAIGKCYCWKIAPLNIKRFMTLRQWNRPTFQVSSRVVLYEPAVALNSCPNMPIQW